MGVSRNLLGTIYVAIAVGLAFCWLALMSAPPQVLGNSIRVFPLISVLIWAGAFGLILLAGINFNSPEKAEKAPSS